jgi:acyl-coenzyme A synthetase/AMP-(fatty) acid ligase
VPSALAQLQQRGALHGLASLRQMLFAGEVFPTPALRRTMADLPGARFANLFGPTETNVFSFHRLDAPPAEDAPVPIGLPCPHAGVTVADDGELLVTGPGVMLGYWREPALTAASRVDGRPDSYRTGDHATRRDDGVLLFTGRRDHLVKLRGQRVELLGLEAVLQAHPAIVEAVAVVTADERLALFLVERTPVRDRDIKAAIAARLPPAYQPALIRRLNAMPRSSNGKADRGTLRDRANEPD